MALSLMLVLSILPPLITSGPVPRAEVVVLPPLLILSVPPLSVVLPVVELLPERVTVPLLIRKPPEKVLLPVRFKSPVPISTSPPAPVMLPSISMNAPLVSRVKFALLGKFGSMPASMKAKLLLTACKVPLPKVKLTLEDGTPPKRLMSPANCRVPELMMRELSKVPSPSAPTNMFWAKTVPPFKVKTPGAAEPPPNKNAASVSTEAPGPTVRQPGPPKPMLNWPSRFQTELFPVTRAEPPELLGWVPKVAPLTLLILPLFEMIKLPAPAKPTSSWPVKTPPFVTVILAEEV